MAHAVPVTVSSQGVLVLLWLLAGDSCTASVEEPHDLEQHNENLRLGMPRVEA